ncbi:MAG: DUF4837 family protein [Bacteroidota bacterium]
MLSRLRKSIFYTLILGLLAFSLNNCATDSALSPKKPAFGDINRLTVIVDTNLVTTSIRDSLAFFFEPPYLILPQPEPIFDLDFTRPWLLQARPAMRKLREYLVLANLDDQYSETNQMVRRDLTEEQLQRVMDEGYISVVARDKWALNQNLYYVVGRDLQSLHNGLREVYPSIVGKLKERQMNRWATTVYAGGSDINLGNTIERKLGVKMRIPDGFREAPIQSDSVVWLRDFIQGGSLNLFMAQTDYTSADQLTEEGYKSIINRIGGQYISSDADSTYLVIHDTDLPTFIEPVQIDGKYALEARGIWEMANDFMAGSFISYLVLDETTNKLTLLMGIIHRPNENKRDLSEQLEVILRNTKFEVSGNP